MLKIKSRRPFKYSNFTHNFAIVQKVFSHSKKKIYSLIKVSVYEREREICARVRSACVKWEITSVREVKCFSLYQGSRCRRLDQCNYTD
jgi:hypothetical protein